MTHYFKLNDSPFIKIANGTKTIELRLYDEKRRVVKVGDIIVFSDKKGNKISVTVNALHIFKSFKELYENLDLTKCGYYEKDAASASYTDMEEYYSADDIMKYGAVGIEIERV